MRFLGGPYSTLLILLAYKKEFLLLECNPRAYISLGWKNHYMQASDVLMKHVWNVGRAPSTPPHPPLKILEIRLLSRWLTRHNAICHPTIVESKVIRKSPFYPLFTPLGIQSSLLT